MQDLFLSGTYIRNYTVMMEQAQYTCTVPQKMQNAVNTMKYSLCRASASSISPAEKIDWGGNTHAVK